MFCIRLIEILITIFQKIYCQFGISNSVEIDVVDSVEPIDPKSKKKYYISTDAQRPICPIYCPTALE